MFTPEEKKELEQVKMSWFDYVTITLFMLAVPVCFIFEFIYWLTASPAMQMISLTSMGIGVINLILLTAKGYATRNN